MVISLPFFTGDVAAFKSVGTTVVMLPAEMLHTRLGDERYLAI
jgi:hypothetical protein